MISIFNQKNNAWRDQYNPLRGMSLPKVLSLLDAGDQPTPKGLRRGVTWAGET